MSDRGRDAFERALDEALRKDRAWYDGLGPSPSPRMRVGVALARAPGSGGAAQFDLAMDWTDEPTDLPAPPQLPPREATGRSGDTPTEIERELGFGAPLTLDELTSRWRDFVWRNHPDRQPVVARERANIRVAIANALYERARRRLAKAR
jgi:hypothetical protein